MVSKNQRRKKDGAQKIAFPRKAIGHRIRRRNPSSPAKRRDLENERNRRRDRLGRVRRLL
jgi:hypothetical protein